MAPHPSGSTDRSVRRFADWLGFGLLWAWIVLSLFFLPWLAGIGWLGAVLGLVGVVLCWQATVAKQYPVTTIGVRREVESEPIAESGHDCDACDHPAGGGERRRYAKRRVLFGSTIAVPEWGVNEYCERCLEAGMAVGGKPDDEPRIGERGPLKEA